MNTVDDDQEYRHIAIPEGYEQIVEHLRDVLKVTKDPTIDSGVRSALWWITQCDPIVS